MRGELPPAVGVACLQDHGVHLRASRRCERAGNVEIQALVLETGRAGCQELTLLLVGGDRVRRPGLPQLTRGLHELGGAHVPVTAVQVAAAAEVLAGERVGRRHHVPPGPAAGQVVKRGELAGDLVRLVVRRLDGPGQAQVVGHRGDRREHGDRVRAADHVQVVDLAALLAQPQPFGEEEEVERAGLGGPRQVRERAELDLAARRGVAPHRVVVDAGEVGPEDHLLAHAGLRS